MNEFLNLILTGSLLLLLFLILTNSYQVNKIANKWLCLFLICVFFITLEDSLLSIDSKYNLFIFETLSNISCFFVAPSFYLSICNFINPIRKWRNKDILHFVLSIIFCLFLINIHFLSTKFILDNPFLEKILPYIIYLFIGLLASQLIIYGILSLKKIRKHQKNIELFSSNIDKINLKWLESIVIFVFLISILWAFDLIINLSEYTKFPILNFLVLLLVYFIAYHATNQREIFLFNEKQKNQIVEIFEESKTLNKKIVQPEIKKKIISDIRLEEIRLELLDLMINKKLFLDSELNLVKLSKITNISIHQLSYVINTSFNENFFLFVNRFRIEESKKIILNPEMKYLSILGIGFEVGFNSKTAFNTTFKKITGETPTDFKNKNKNL